MRLSEEDGGYTVGVLVQANYGDRERLAIEGVPVGREIPPERVPVGEVSAPPERGSIIIVVATDAPVLPPHLGRLAQRAGLGVARVGGAGENGSGDIFAAFSTANRELAGGGAKPVTMLGNDSINPLFYATIEATEEAIVNAMLQAETMTGKGGVTVHRLDPELLLDVMRTAGRVPQPT